MKRKLLIVFFVIAIASVMLAITSIAAEPIETWDISATENDSVFAYLYADETNEGMYTLTISGTGYMKDWAFGSSDSPIPCNIDISYVKIENGVLNIGSAAFKNSRVKNVEIQNSVISIGNDAFLFSSLTSVNIPDSVLTIGDSAFAGCEQLETVKIGCGVKTINFGAFAMCESLEEIIFSNNITEIWDRAFENCTSLKNIKLHEGIKIIGTCAFASTGLTEVTVPRSVELMGDGAFCANMKLKSAKILCNPLEYGGLGIFSGCKELTEVVISKNVNVLSMDAFYSCNPKLVIYAEAEKQPSGWDEYWNVDNRTVIWNCKSFFIENIFTFKGYSTRENGIMAICAGYTIDYDNVAKYEELTEEVLDFGIVFAGFDNLNGKQPLNGDGTTAKLDKGKVIKYELNTYTYMNYDFLIKDITENRKDTAFVISAYIYNGQTVKYNQGSISEIVKPISYNQIF